MLYGENTFLHSCNAWIFTPHDYLEVGFPDQNIQQIKHLELQVQPKLGAEGQVSINFGATVQYFVDRGCDLQTFRLWLNELGSTNGDDDRVIYSAYGENTSEHIALWLVAHSDELLTALVGLKVSKTLTISLSYSQKMVFYDETQQEVSGIFRDHLIKSLAFQKNFTVTEHMGFDIEFLGDKEFSEDREDDGSKDDKSEDIGSEDSEFFDEDDAESYFTWYGFSWCLRPQHSKAQTDSASA